MIIYIHPQSIYYPTLFHKIATKNRTSVQEAYSILQVLSIFKTAIPKTELFFLFHKYIAYGRYSIIPLCCVRNNRLRNSKKKTILTSRTIQYLTQV